MTTWFAFTSMAALVWLGASLFLVVVASRVAALADSPGPHLLELLRHERVNAGLAPASFRR